MNKKAKVLMSSVATIAMTASLAVGGTYALFTSEDKVNVAVTSGTVKVEATVENLQYKTLTVDTWQEATGDTVTFDNLGGSATVADGSVILDKIVPGDAVKFDVVVTNYSNVGIMYRTNIVNDILKDTGLFAGLQVKVNDQAFTGSSISNWTALGADTEGTTVATVPVEITLPDTGDNAYDNQFQNTSCAIDVVVEAVQGNGVLKLPAGVSEESFGSNLAVDENGNYYANFEAAVESGASTLYLKPNADLGTVTHFNMQGDLTIYGNYATITGGECDIAVDTYTVFTQDVTLNIYNVNNIAVWGERKSDVTLNINLEGCNDLRRVYIGGTSGVTNVTIKDCTFDGTTGYQNTAVYTNNPGTINMENVTVTSYAIGLNQNNKSAGTQNLNLTNCTFINCSTQAIATATNSGVYAAPVRVVATEQATAVSNLNLTNCQYVYTNGQSAINGNLLTLDTRENAVNYGKVNVTIDGVVYENYYWVNNDSGLSDALKADSKTVDVTLSASDYTLPSVSGKEVSIAGTKDTVITVNKPNCSGSDVSLSGVTVVGSGYATGIQHVNTVTYDNVTIQGEMCLYGNKVVFNNCTFELNNQYIWTYGAKEVEFNNCTFNTTGKAILIYNEGAGASEVTVKGCTFNATTSAKAGAIANQNCAAIEIDNFQSSGTGTAHQLITDGNTYNSNFSGEWRIKSYTASNAVTVNGVKYTSIAIDGKTMTIDENKNVTVNE